MTMRPAEAHSATADQEPCSGLELIAKLADGSIRRPPMAEILPFSLLLRKKARSGCWPARAALF